MAEPGLEEGAGTGEVASDEEVPLVQGEPLDVSGMEQCRGRHNQQHDEQEPEGAVAPGADPGARSPCLRPSASPSP